MVRLLDRFWGAKVAPACRAGLRKSRPADGTYQKPSFRPQLEPLEDRLTPAISLNFFPVAHVAINPAPLPPLALVEFDPLPNLASAMAGMSTQQEHIAVVLSKQISIGSATGGAGTGKFDLEVSYNLDASVSENVVPPSPFAAGSYMAMFSVTGTLTEFLAPVAPTTGTTWLINATVNEQGSISGALNMPSPVAPVVDTLMWNAQMSENGTFLQITFGLVSTTQIPWQEQSQSNSQGSVMELVSPVGGLTLSASFTQQDVVTACFMQPPSPFHPPSPCITISAVINTWGSVTENVFIPPGPASFPEVNTGTTQYTDSLAENIMFADGSLRFFTESSQNSGIFIIAILVG